MKSYKILSFLFLISLTFNNFLEAEPIPLEKLYVAERLLEELYHLLVDIMPQWFHLHPLSVL